MVKFTARDVAKQAGTSVSAVSRAFRVGSSISDETRRRILHVAEELNYQVPSTQTDRKALPSTISLVVSDLKNPFYPSLVEELSIGLERTGRRLVVHVAPTLQAMENVMDQVLGYSAEGVITTSAIAPNPLVTTCRKKNLPLVMVNRIVRDQTVNAVACDNYAGGRLVGHRIIESGRRKIAFVGGLIYTSTHQDRARGFHDVLAEANLPPPNHIAGEFNYEIAFQNVLDVVTDPARRPDAIFCVNDIMALAAIDAILRVGLQAGRDIAVIGFDDIAMAAWESYRLTTVRQPVRAMICETIDLIEKLSKDPSLTGITRTVSGRMIERDSG